MNTRDNAKVIETIERCTLFNYFEKLVDAPTRKVTLFGLFPYTAAANLADPRRFFMLDDIARLTSLNCGNPNN
ncbi:hypothetical protein A2625_05295 [candidate division WOR-1 bacterium RIFCSPHIGHO2_01_FULL_53_15]|uniref:Uncharacterized protein n=1 Tax=candidate division WOR-1 bacterium RIFCSPHIGHO2_01_FULL_53_15 TaxID=1802564 RepID=A0A1F4Q1U0_UNCSA|nr:MAG: hypothetical protein A2625_05295 [candidate division WOR-1 bacterium RIFCSPHIGHO2_01_FULL_53_15]OGC13085.1 MAG: hypothetical protein A3D23_00240 [candidate division WOR-1 bacterium RIFCSPHIGHO2_02_FULL_53_26]